MKPARIAETFRLIPATASRIMRVLYDSRTGFR